MSEGQTAWHQSKAFLIGAVIIIGPLAIPLIWINKSLTTTEKGMYSLAVIALSVLLYSLSNNMTRSVSDQMEEVQLIRESF